MKEFIMKFLLSAIAASAAALVMAAGTSIVPAQVSDFQKINGKGELTLNADKVFEIKGYANYRSAATLAIDPNKTYKLTGEFMANGKSPSVLYFGFITLNDKKQSIYSEQIFAVPGTETVLAEDVKAGDKEIKLKDCSKWKFKGGHVAFNIKDDLSDLPNKNISPSIKSYVKTGDVYTVTLASPIRKAYAKGTAVRQHRAAGTYLYSATAGRKLTNQWQTFSATVNGVSPKENPVASKKFWYTTKNVKILILGNHLGKADASLLFKNIKLEELTR